jgi:sugar phosphate isomerase/epimerase
MQLGIFAKTFPGDDPSVVLGAVRAAGYTTTQFNLVSAGLAALPEAVPAGAIARIRAATAASGVSIAALSGTYNMAHPDPAVRGDGRRRLAAVIEAAASLEVPLVTLCTGTRHPDNQWAYHPANAEASAWADMAAEIGQALVVAERHGVDLGIEPEQANIVTSASQAIRLIGELGSPRLRVVLDPANLFERATPAEARAIVARAIAATAAHLALAHAKDRDAGGRFVAAGKGVVDFADFVARLRSAGFDGALVAHGLSEAEAPEVARFLATLP